MYLVKMPCKYIPHNNEIAINYGLITEVKNDRTLVKIDGVSALKKYADWIGKKPSDLKGQNLLVASITKPLGVKDPLGNLTVVRHPMFGDDMGTKTYDDDMVVKPTL